MTKLLEIENLHVTFNTPEGAVKAVRGVSFSVDRGETVAVVGESGCGKTVACQAILGLNPPSPLTSTSGAINLSGLSLLDLSENEQERLRGSEMGMIFQDPMTSLNPTMTIGKQVMEGIIRHKKVSAKIAKVQTIEMLEHVGISSAGESFDRYPHSFSGGMRQRVMIAIALACGPRLLIADEPTTALDVTIQAQILQLMKKIQQKSDLSIILVTHDLGIVASTCDRVVVMYAGKVVEEAPVKELFHSPQHPYTKALLHAVPRLGQDRTQPLSTIEGRPPDLLNPPKGCPFWPRCSHAMTICKKEMPAPTSKPPSQHHNVACWLQHPLAKSGGYHGK